VRARITGCACGVPGKVNGSEDSVDIGTSYLCVYNLIQCPHVQAHMAGTAEVVTLMDKLPGVTCQVLVPNEKGLETALCLLAAHPDKPPVDEIAVFTAAIDASSLVNTNATVADPLKRLERVVRVRWTKASRLAGPSASSLRVRTAAMRIAGACGT